MSGKILTPTDGYTINSGYFTVSGELDSVDGYAWIFMGRSDYHYLMWPKIQVPMGNFSVSVFEGGDPGAVVCRLVQVNQHDHERCLAAYTTDEGIHCPDFIQFDFVNLNKIGDRMIKP
jgi:hypothetical protein